MLFCLVWLFGLAMALVIAVIVWVNLCMTWPLYIEQHQMVLECSIPGIERKLAVHNGCGCGNDVLRVLAAKVVPHLGEQGSWRNKKLNDVVIRLTRNNVFPSISDRVWPSVCSLQRTLKEKSDDPVYAMVSAQVHLKSGAVVRVPLPEIRVSGKWKFNEKTASLQYLSVLRRICGEEPVRTESPDLLRFRTAKRKGIELCDTIDVGDGKRHVLFGGTGLPMKDVRTMRFNRVPGGWVMSCCVLHSSFYSDLETTLNYFFVTSAVYLSGYEP